MSAGMDFNHSTNFHYLGRCHSERNTLVLTKSQYLYSSESSVGEATSKGLLGTVVGEALSKEWPCETDNRTIHNMRFEYGRSSKNARLEKCELVYRRETY